MNGFLKNYLNGYHGKYCNKSFLAKSDLNEHLKTD